MPVPLTISRRVSSTIEVAATVVLKGIKPNR
jgi:hypothetical protein